MKRLFVRSVACGLSTLAFCLTVEAWTVDASGVATVASGETKQIASNEGFDAEGVKKVAYADGTSKLSLADGIVLTNQLQVSGNGITIYEGSATLEKGYYAYSASPYQDFSNGGTVTYNGPVNGAGGNGWVQLRNGGNGGGMVILNTNGNLFAQFRFVSSVGVKLGAADALYSASGTGGVDFNGATYTGPGLDLNGFSTRMKTLNTDDLQASEGWGTGAFALVKSATPATLQVEGVNADGRNFPFKFADKASFLYNAAGKTLNLVNVVSSSSGDLGVANGTLVMKWNAGWSGDTVTVTGGVFQIASPKTFSNSNVCFTVTSPGAVVLEQDVYVDRLIIDGEEIPQGKKYMADELDNFSGGGSICVKYEPKDPTFDTYVWTGTDGQSLTATGVWKDGKAPDLTDGGATLTFSEGGASATVVDDLSIYAVQFLSTFPFSLAGTAGKSVAMANGFVVNAAAEPTVTATVAADIEMTAANAAPWTIGANAALKLDGDVSSKGSSTLDVSGDGALYLNGDNSGMKRPLELNNALVVVGSETGLGSAKAVVSQNTTLRFDCLTNDSPFKMTWNIKVGGKDVNRPSIAGLGTLVLNGWFDAGNLSYVDISGLRIRGGMSSTEYTCNNNFYVFGNNDAWIENEPMTLSGGVGAAFIGGGSLHLGVACTYDPSFGVRNYGAATARLVCERDAVLDPKHLFTFGRASDGQNGILDLNGHDQGVLALATYAYNDPTHVTEKGASFGVVTSAVPATLTIAGTPSYANGAQGSGSAYYQFSAGAFSPTNSVAFRGAASLVFAATGDKVTSFVNGKSDTTGTLTVNSGTLVFDWGAGWTSATNVTINGGVLRVASESAACAFGPSAGRSKTPLYLNGAGKLELDTGVQATVRALAVDGTFVSAGVYGGSEAGLDADHTLPQLAGKGRVRVLRYGLNSGLAIIVR